MTVVGKVKETLASLKGTQATLEQMAALAKNQEARQTLTRNSQRMDQVIKNLEKRTGVLELEEPQYKGF